LAQNREISEIRYLVADIDASGETDEISEDPREEAATLENTPNNTLNATLDPSPHALSDLPESATWRTQTGAAVPSLSSRASRDLQWLTTVSTAN
jgi:hypothetical protein